MIHLLTSLLAIVALVAGKALGWVWMDPLMGREGQGGEFLLRCL